MVLQVSTCIKAASLSLTKQRQTIPYKFTHFKHQHIVVIIIIIIIFMFMFMSMFILRLMMIFLFSWQPFCHRPGPQPPPGRPVRPGSRGRRPQTVSMQRSMPAKPEVFPDLHLGRWVSLEMARMRLKPGTAIKMMWSSDRIDDSDKIGFDVRIWLYIYLLLFTICVKWRIKVFLQFDIYGK